MLKKLWCILSMLYGMTVVGQKGVLLNNVDSNIKVHIDSLTSECFKGRGIIHGGANVAANYIEQQFSLYQLERFRMKEGESFNQTFDVACFGAIDSTSSITVVGKTYFLWKDFSFYTFNVTESLGELYGRHAFIAMYESESKSQLKYRAEQTYINGEIKLIFDETTYKSARYLSIVCDSINDKDQASLEELLDKPYFLLTSSPHMSKKLQKLGKKLEAI